MSRVAFDHIAVGLHRIEDALPFLVGELGGRPAGGGATRAFLFRQWTYGSGKLEVLAPSGPPGGFLHRFLDRRGPGVHHVTFLVPELDAACSLAESLGFPVVERDDSDPDWKEAFLHPKGSQSIVVQIVESRPSPPGASASALREPDPGDPEPGSVGIQLVGLRLAARDLERARALWRGLLGGIWRPLDPGEAEVRWPGSAMRLVVRQTAGEEGPTAVEIACLRPVLLPRGRHPILGTVFDPVDITELPLPPSQDDSGDGDAGARDAGAFGTEDGDEIYLLDPDALSLEGGDPP